MLGDNRTVIRTRYEKGEEPRGWGGGEGEGVRRVKDPLVTITCNLAVPATHHRISTIHRILLGPPGCAQVFPYLSPGPLDFLVVCKITNKPHASHNYTQDQLSVHTAAENDRCKERLHIYFQQLNAYKTGHPYRLSVAQRENRTRAD